MKAVGIILALVLLAGTVWAQQDPKDAGIADTLRFSGGPLIVGESSPIQVTFFTDLTVIGLSFCPKFTSLDSGFAKFDSVVFQNHLADPSILDMRFTSIVGIDDLSPDSLTIGMVKFQENPLPPVHEEVMQVYFTGIQPGRMLVDTGHGTIGSTLKFVTGSTSHRPMVVSSTVEILGTSPDPSLNLPDANLPFTLLEGVSLTPSAQSPVGRPVTVTNYRLANFDVPARQPMGSVLFTTGNPAAFVWEPSLADLGMWYVVFTACDDESRCRDDSLVIEVVTKSEFALTFDQHETARKTSDLAILRGDFNGDGYDEFVTATGSGGDSTDILAVFRLNGDSFEKTYNYNDAALKKGVQVGYVDGDDKLDIVNGTNSPLADRRQLRTFAGNGDGTFSITATFDIASMTSGTLAEFTGDQYLDYVLAKPLACQIFQGGAGGTFTPIGEFALMDTVKSVNAADVDGDGASDLLIGTISGIDIYLNNDSGTFALANRYAQDFRALDLDVTTQGSDFNNDGAYDLSVATPSVGGEFSEVVAYLGNGDGTFNPHTIRTVKGQVFATVIGDFNNDLELDIAFTNSARKYVGILYGDGTGEFANEQRFFTPTMSPRALEASDVDRDGDLDLVVGSYYQGSQTKLTLMRNRFDPIGYMPVKFLIASLNNGLPEIGSPSGQTLNSVKRTIASGSAFARNADGNDQIDEVLTATSIESGPYAIRVIPKPNQPATDPFSIDFSVDGKHYRLAHDQPNRPGGYQFTIYPDGSSPVTPASGALCSLPNPQLTWASSGDEVLEIASDLAFTDIIETASITEGKYTPVHAVAGADTSTYYWRVKDVQSTWVSDIRVFSVLPTPTAVDPEANDGLPIAYGVSQNYPNPFNPTTTIAFTLPQAERVVISVFDITGRLVNRLTDKQYSAGEHTITWDGTDSRRRAVSSGVYLYRIEAEGYRAQKKMTLLR